MRKASMLFWSTLYICLVILYRFRSCFAYHVIFQQLLDAMLCVVLLHRVGAVCLLCLCDWWFLFWMLKFLWNLFNEFLRVAYISNSTLCILAIDIVVFIICIQE